MVQAVIRISEHANRILNVVKAKYDLRDKSQAIEVVTKQYEMGIMEPELRPEYIRKLQKIEKQKKVAVKDFSKQFGLK